LPVILSTPQAHSQANNTPNQKSVAQGKGTQRSPPASAPPRKAQRVQGDNRQGARDSDAQGNKWSITDTVQAISAGVTAIATVALAGFAAMQIMIYRRQTRVMDLSFRATRRAVHASQRSATAAEAAIDKGDAALTHAQSTANRQLRAYVSVERVNFQLMNHKPDEPASGVLNVAIYWKNFGSTPANNIHINFAFRIFRWPDTVPDDFDFPGNPDFVSARGAFAPTQGIWANVTLPMGAVYEAWQNKAFIPIWSFIEYDDTQGTRRRTEWSSQVGIGRNEQDKTWGFSATAYPRFNAIDEFCSRQPTQAQR
jgi:hypothetical protein